MVTEEYYGSCERSGRDRLLHPLITGIEVAFRMWFIWGGDYNRCHQHTLSSHLNPSACCGWCFQANFLIKFTLKSTGNLFQDRHFLGISVFWPWMFVLEGYFCATLQCDTPLNTAHHSALACMHVATYLKVLCSNHYITLPLILPQMVSVAWTVF